MAYISFNGKQQQAIDKLLPFYCQEDVQGLVDVLLAEAYRDYITYGKK